MVQRHAHRTGSRDARNQDVFDELLSLFVGHPTWKDRHEEIASIRVTRNPAGKSLLLQIKLREKKRWLTVSWRDCATKTATGRDRKPKPPIAERNRLDGAMRYAVRRQTQGWGRQHALGAACVACETTDTKLQVDHVHPFVEIMRAFLLQWQGAVPDQFDTCRRTCQPRLRRTDVGFARAWQRYHTIRATYQWLCRSCNARKGARVVDLKPS